jgi:multiple sugar transport system permease protein
MASSTTTPESARTLPGRPATPARAGNRRRRSREARTFYLFISPWLIGFTIFTAIPMGASLYLSLTDWDAFQAPNFIGLDNYVRLFTDDPLFWKSLRNTAYFALVSVPLSLMLALFLANLLSRPLKGVRIFRTVIYVPVLVPLVSAAMIFRWLLAPDTGPINGFLALFGIDGPAWLQSESWVIPAVILLSLWQVGSGTILLIAALQGVPTELYEAASIDGASTVRQFWSISVPLVTPIIFFNLITGVILAFQVFAQVYVLTEGRSGPNNASLMMVPYMYDNAFQYYRMGYASAVAWVLLAVILLLSLVILKSGRRWVYYETDVNR